MSDTRQTPLVQSENIGCDEEGSCLIIGSVCRCLREDSATTSKYPQWRSFPVESTHDARNRLDSSTERRKQEIAPEKVL